MSKDICSPGCGRDGHPSSTRLAAAALCAALAAGWPVAAAAQAPAFPVKPIRMIVPFPPAGSSDIIARIMGQKMTEAWGQPVLVDSRPGAGGSLGAEIASKTPPDGYTVFVGNAAPISTNPLLIKVNYDSLRDFAPVTLVARAPQLVVVHPSVPVKSIKELVAWVKAEGGKVDYGSSGIGTIAHLATEMFKSMTGTDMAHIAYKGMPLTMNALVASEVKVVFSDMAPAMVQVKAGKLRPLAVTSGQRFPLLPDMPTVSEVLPGFDIANWWGLFVTAGTPAPIIAQMNTTLVKALQSPEVRDKFAGLGVEAVSSTPAELAALVKSEMASFGALIKSQNIRAQ
ncbi:MAG: tripartite tricarboxylate transporter substrate binding protein [bacterium]|jgi:tripartite-type tricarboxylate transporter receptor subunit TctC|nr:tripartite tricarboxylate transporter substrate binding protein [Betaproteobacteria bacterium]